MGIQDLLEFARCHRAEGHTRRRLWTQNPGNSYKQHKGELRLRDANLQGAYQHKTPKRACSDGPRCQLRNRQAQNLLETCQCGTPDEACDGSAAFEKVWKLPMACQAARKASDLCSPNGKYHRAYTGVLLYRSYGDNGK